MADLVLTVFLDGLMAVLLMITTVYCWKLNKRIRILQDSRSELAQIIRQFDESTREATKAIAEIHEATRNLTDNIQLKIDKASYLADDLEIMIDRGAKMAGRMDSSGGYAASPEPVARKAAPSRPAAKPSRRPIMEDENVEVESVSREEVEAARQRGRQKSSLDSVLKKVSGRRDEPGTEAQAKPGARLRSKAEEELFDALKTGNR
jgi:phage-related minor tail protein